MVACAAVAPRSDAGEVERERMKRIGLSLLLPGSAQLRAGDTTRGIAFLAADLACWTGFAAYRLQGAERRESSIEMAHVYAGVQAAEGRTEDYYRLLGVWASSETYDALVRDDARFVHEDDLVGREEYFQANRIPADKAWQWESFAAQQRYSEKRNESKRSNRLARNLAGLAVVNRLVAMFDATVLSGRDSDGATHLQFRPSVKSGRVGARLAISRSLW